MIKKLESPMKIKVKEKKLENRVSFHEVMNNSKNSSESMELDQWVDKISQNENLINRNLIDFEDSKEDKKLPRNFDFP